MLFVVVDVWCGGALCQCCGSVMVFAWDSVTKTSTIVEEFAPGTEEMIIGPVAGGVRKTWDTLL
jgi:hypothetical protein